MDDVGQSASWMWLATTALGAVILGLAFLYGIMQWTGRRRDPLLERIQERATREGYRDGNWPGDRG
ncbi:MAG: hypothetical protein U1E56_02700 [Bauldia sp.]